MEILFYLAIVMLSGLIFARLVGYIKLPDVTGYLIAGILIGPSVLKLVPIESVKSMELISQVALGIIAYITGIELKFSAIKKSGKGIIIVTFFEVLAAFLFVAIPMIYVFNQSVAFSIVLGAIATATAPAATLMVIKQYRAKGPVVDTLIPVVALDDGFCIMLFGVCITVAKSLLTGASLSFMSMVVHPSIEIFGALLLGFVFGIITILILTRFENTGSLTTYILATIFILTYLSVRFKFSSLLVMLSYGSTISNLSNQYHKAVNAVEGLTAPIFLSFFVISGADLDLSVVSSVGLIGAAYIVFRIFGKVVGTYYSAKACKMPETVYKWLGFTLIPQAGVAIGLALLSSQILPEPYGTQIRTIILAATIFYEIVGPVGTKISLKKAGEIN
ncbi:MAG: cation:proton antiporter [Tissierellia bacterium]|nr:cation:proton antiporter [Tissierellia bacterium]